MILFASVFGRIIVNRFGVLNSLAPCIEAFIVLALLLFSSRFVSNFPKAETHSGHIDRLELIASCCCLVVLVLVSETLIEVSVERVHFAKYGVLAFFFYFSRFLPARVQSIAGAVAAAALFGAFDESLQAFVPQRFFDLKDILLNFTGAVFGGAVTWTTLIIRPDLRQLSPGRAKPFAQPE